MPRLIFHTILFLGVASQAWAGTLDDAFQILKDAKTIKCVFSSGYVADWQTGKMEPKTDKTIMTAHFDAIDWKAGKARSLGNQGAANERVTLTPSGLNFIEETNSGNLTVTTVFAAYKAGTNEFIAVFSRHMNILGVAIPSQYHGTCMVLPSQ